MYMWYPGERSRAVEDDLVIRSVMDLRKKRHNWEATISLVIRRDATYCVSTVILQRLKIPKIMKVRKIIR